MKILNIFDTAYIDPIEKQIYKKFKFDNNNKI